jgi:aminoglycoside phosphotransferase (APT) family kinase protein
MKFSAIERKPASFQKPLAAETLSRLCAALIGSDVEIGEICEFGSGLFNNSYHIRIAGEPGLVLRASPDPGCPIFRHEECLLRRELAVERFLRLLGELVPRTVASDFTHEIVPRDVVVQTFLSGELWDGIKDSLTAAENEVLWRQLGGIARKIHSVPGDRFGLPPPKSQFASWHLAFLDLAAGMLEDLKRFGIDPKGVSEFLRLARDGRPQFAEVDEPRLVHGDLWPKNVLIDRKHGAPKIAGLLDAERAIWGDPLAEWVFHYYEMPDAFWEGYGTRMKGPGAEFRSHTYAGLYSIQIILEGWREGYDTGFARKRLQDSMEKMSGILGRK